MGKRVVSNRSYLLNFYMRFTTMGWEGFNFIVGIYVFLPHMKPSNKSTVPQVLVFSSNRKIEVEILFCSSIALTEFLGSDCDWVEKGKRKRIA